MASKLVLTFNADGSVRSNAADVEGTEDEILALLATLAATVDGSVTVEGHAPGVAHDHHTHKGGVTHKH